LMQIVAVYDFALDYIILINEYITIYPFILLLIDL
jgi:hypothetical protein